MDRLRVGTLGAARITPRALIAPARLVSEVVVTAVAARDPARARRFAAKHGIPVVHDSYEGLIADPEVDAIYNPLPNSLHAPWTLRAIAAGKHVLCEKPFASNEAEAAEVADAARVAGLVVMEAFHYRYHPLARRMQEIANGQPGELGELGELRHVEASLCFPVPRSSDIRFQFDLAGGATMDAGCYPINCIRMLGPGEPTVVSAVAKLRGPEVDRAMVATFRFDGGVTGRIRTSLWSGQVLRIGARAVGERGEMRVFNYLAPQSFSLLRVSARRSGGSTRWERVRGEATYTYQLRAFASAVLRGEPVLTTADDAVANMRQIDDVYRAAGLAVRGTVPGVRGTAPGVPGAPGAPGTVAGGI
ncbi:MAG TPA: Gfo/Idh/MocA family oxidoreductase [Streptosporangiaceae bacterium]|nr:Gfo/Idh/MocA family oxidoreductase [Streptosporangiaceae bacterium]